MLNIIAGTLSVGVTPSTSSYESIATYTVSSGGQADITFSSIPSTYKHLQVRYIARKSGAANDTVGILLNFNSDSSSVYTQHTLQGDGTVAAAGFTGTDKTNTLTYMAGGGMTASTFGAGVIDILDYADTNKFKTTRTLNGVSSNASSAIDYIFLVSGLWRSTSAITSITLTGNNFAQYSHFALYGIKGV